jgi:hypothetical protein
MDNISSLWRIWVDLKEGKTMSKKIIKLSNGAIIERCKSNKHNLNYVVVLTESLRCVQTFPEAMKLGVSAVNVGFGYLRFADRCAKDDDYTITLSSWRKIGGENGYI